MTKFIMLCGIPASGKSEYTRKILNINPGIVVHSSDELREELFGSVEDQNNNNELFEELHRRVKKDLLEGRSVVYDATNISSKRRKHVLNTILSKIECEKQIIYFGASSNRSSIRNLRRPRKVPSGTIERMFKSMQIPQYKEGWDHIEIKLVDSLFSDKQVYNIGEPSYMNVAFNLDLYGMHYNEDYIKFLKYMDLYELIYNKPQNNTYHSFSIDRHIYKTYEYIKNKYLGKYKDEMLWAALMHDVGKEYCRVTDSKTLYDQFIGHENVSAQIALDRMVRMKTIDGEYMYNMEFILRVVDIIQNHMLYLDNHKLMKDKLNMDLDQEFIEMMEFFKEADTNAK